MDPVICFLGLSYKVQQTGQFKTTEVYSLLVLRLGVCDQCVGRPRSPLRALGENPSCLFLASGGCKKCLGS